jgi:hypothetical protein
MTMPFARISITLPSKDLAAADRLAAQQDRSRSWIVAEAIRRYAAEVEAGAGAAAQPVARGDHPGLGASRLIQVDRDLSMTAAERVREAEEAADAVAAIGRPGGGIEEPRWFGSYEEFAAWRRLRQGP